jgi:hypothetical protein
MISLSNPIDLVQMANSVPRPLPLPALASGLHDAVAQQTPTISGCMFSSNRSGFEQFWVLEGARFHHALSISQTPGENVPRTPLDCCARLFRGKKDVHKLAKKPLSIQPWYVVRGRPD